MAAGDDVEMASEVAATDDVEMTPAEAIVVPASAAPSADAGEVDVTTKLTVTAAASSDVAPPPAPAAEVTAVGREDDSIAAGTTADVPEVEVESRDDRSADPIAVANEEPAEKKARL